MQAARGVESSPLGVVVVDACHDAHPVLYASRGLAQLLADDPDELVGRPLRELPELIGGAGDLERLRGSLEAKEPAVGLWRTVTATGAILWLEVIATPAILGTPTWVLVFSDVTGRQARLAAAEDEERRLRALVEDLPVVVYSDEVDHLGDDAARRIYVSAPIEELTGFSAAEMRSDPQLWQGRQLPPAPDAHRQPGPDAPGRGDGAVTAIP